MSIAEQKMELLRLIVEADEETTEKFLQLLKKEQAEAQKFSDEELEKFHATRQKYLNSSDSTILLEDAHAYIRSLKHK